MLKRIRTHASFANLTAVIAVFVAVGGTSYAAITLPRNSVGERQLNPALWVPTNLKQALLARGRSRMEPSNLAISRARRKRSRDSQAHEGL